MLVPMIFTTLWALEISPAVSSLLQELQQASLSPDQVPSVGHASATLRDALVRGLNELATRAGLQALDLAAEREPEGTRVSPIVTNPLRGSEPVRRK